MRRLVIIVLLMLVLPSLAWAQAPVKTPATSDVSAIKQLVRQLADATTKEDLTTWEKICAPNVVVFEQGTKDLGWSDFRDNHLKKEFDAYDFKLDAGPVEIHLVGKAFAWATGGGDVTGASESGKPVKLTFVWTLLFENTDGAWKLVHYHLSHLS